MTSIISITVNVVSYIVILNWAKFRRRQSSFSQMVWKTWVAEFWVTIIEFRIGRVEDKLSSGKKISQSLTPIDQVSIVIHRPMFTPYDINNVCCELCSFHWHLIIERSLLKKILNCLVYILINKYISIASG